MDQIEGIGEKRKKLLLRSFNSLMELSSTSLDVLARMEGMNRPTAKRVLDFLKGT